MKEEIIKINKSDVELLEKAKTLLLSKDKEISLLGHQIFMTSDFYKKCSQKNLINECHLSFKQEVEDLKEYIIKYNGYSVLVSNLFNRIENNKFNIVVPIEIDTTEEREYFDFLYDELLNIKTPDAEHCRSFKDLLLKSKIIQNNNYNLFRDINNDYHRIKSLQINLGFYYLCYKVMLDLMNKMSKGKIILYKQIPVYFTLE